MINPDLSQTVAELVTIPGLEDPDAGADLKKRAEGTMERMRHQRIEEAATRTEPLTERDLLRFVSGVGLRTLHLLEESGYRTVRDLAREDPDRLAIKTGLGIKKARQVQQGAVYFLEHEAADIDAARAKAQAARAAAASAADINELPTTEDESERGPKPDAGAE